MRKPIIVRCSNCDEVIGIKTENGIMVANLIVDELEGKCGCGEKFYIKRLYREDELDIDFMLSNQS